MKISHLFLIGVSSLFLAGCTLPFQQQTISVAPEELGNPEASAEVVPSPDIARLSDKDGRTKIAGIYTNAIGQEVGQTSITVVSNDKQEVTGYYFNTVLDANLMGKGEYAVWLLNPETAQSQMMGKLTVFQDKLVVNNLLSESPMSYTRAVVTPADSTQPEQDALVSTELLQL